MPYSVKDVVKKERKVSRRVKREATLIQKLQRAIVDDSKLILEKEKIIQEIRKKGPTKKLVDLLNILINKNSKKNLKIELNLDKNEIKQIEDTIRLLQKAIKEENLIKPEELPLDIGLKTKLSKVIGSLDRFDRQMLLDEFKILRILQDIEKDVENSIHLIAEQRKILAK